MNNYVIAPRSKKLPPFIYWDNLFSGEELKWLRDKARAADGPAMVGGSKDSNGVNPDIRRSSLQWLNTDDARWVFERLEHCISTINANYYNFDITCFGEAIQLTHYDSSVKGFYDWHQDNGGEGFSRKLSFVCQLTDPSEFEGGNLEIQVHPSHIEKVRKQMGLVVVFPSYTLHRVTPVTAGTRQSMVCWVTGPQFR